MDDTLKRRLIGATVLLLAALALTSLLPGPERGGDSRPVVAYDLRTGKPLNLPPDGPAPPPVLLKPVELGSTESLEPDASSAPQAGARQPEQQSGAQAAAVTAHAGHPALKVDENFGSGDGSWFVQIGSFASRDNARLEMQKLFKLGLPAMMQNIVVSKKLWYRVRVGPYTSEPPAQQALASLHARGYDSAKVVRPDSVPN